MKIQRFEDIRGWQLARELPHEVYKTTNNGSFSKDWGLRDQINRATGSAMDNIAEGFDAGSNADFSRFLRYAQRSCSEVASQLYRAFDRGHITQREFDKLFDQATHARSAIGAFIKFLKA